MPHSVFGCSRLAAAILVTICCLHPAAAPAQDHLAVGLHDVVVLDPGVHERGFPAVQLEDAGKGLRIDIPPAVHVHRYYYSGNKEIQGPIISGGPTVVVANHPKTGERMYVDVMLPAGAPRIAYNEHGITYVYPDKRVGVTFRSAPFLPKTAIVRQKSGRGLKRNAQSARNHVRQHVKTGLDNSPVFQSLKESCGETRDLLTGVKVSISDLAVQGSDSLKQLTHLFPGVVPLKSIAEQEPQRDYSSLIRTEGLEKARTAIPFVPTNR